MIPFPTGRALAWWLMRRASWYLTLGPMRDFVREAQASIERTHELLARLDREGRS